MTTGNNYALSEPQIVFTAGHSNRNISELLDLLHSANIQTVIDCRTRPRSRWPQFNQNQLKAHLENAGMVYEPRGQNIGGLAGNVEFDETLNEIAQRAENGERIALLCSEGKYQDCHRGTLLAPALEKRGIAIGHLLYGVKKVASQRSVLFKQKGQA